jgi:predicted nucleic acid-binding protein
MPAEHPQPIFLDATVCSNFASTDGVDLLVELLDAPAVTPEVRGEIEAGLKADHDYLRDAVAAFDETLPIRGSLIDGDHAILSELDTGEAATLLAAIEHGGTVATDDLAARRAAKERDVPVTGSIGLLVLAVEQELIDVATADDWLNRWRAERGYYAPVDSVRELLDERR